MRHFFTIVICVHVVIGLIGIATGLIVLGGAYFRKRMDRLNAVFLVATAGASLTGFVFLPSVGFTSAQMVGVASIILLLVAAYARYVHGLAGKWNQIYVITAVEAMFLNVLIAITQSFLHFGFLKDVAPTELSPVMLAVKLTGFLLFLALGFAVARRVGNQTPSNI